LQRLARADAVLGVEPIERAGDLILHGLALAYTYDVPSVCAASNKHAVKAAEYVIHVRPADAAAT
jgi:hypothetical protein